MIMIKWKKLASWPIWTTGTTTEHYLNVDLQSGIYEHRFLDFSTRQLRMMSWNYFSESTTNLSLPSLTSCLIGLSAASLLISNLARVNRGISTIMFTVWAKLHFITLKHMRLDDLVRPGAKTKLLGSSSICLWIDVFVVVCLCLCFAKPDWWGLPLNTTGCHAMDSNNLRSTKHITTYIVFRAKHNDHLFEE